MLALYASGRSSPTARFNSASNSRLPDLSFSLTEHSVDAIAAPLSASSSYLSFVISICVSEQLCEPIIILLKKPMTVYFAV